MYTIREKTWRLIFRDGLMMGYIYDLGIWLFWAARLRWLAEFGCNAFWVSESGYGHA